MDHMGLNIFFFSPPFFILLRRVYQPVTETYTAPQRFCKSDCIHDASAELHTDSRGTRLRIQRNKAVVVR